MRVCVEYTYMYMYIVCVPESEVAHVFTALSGRSRTAESSHRSDQGGHDRREQELPEATGAGERQRTRGRRQAGHGEPGGMSV